MAKVENKEPRKPGRPEKVGERKISITVSVLPSTEKKAKKMYGTLGAAIEFAVNNPTPKKDNKQA